MYEAFFNLRENPFGTTPDPRYLYKSAAHREALAYLAYGEPISSQWYLVGLGKDIGDLTRGGLYFFATPDGSFVLNPRLDISIAQNADLIIFGGYTMGDDEGAFPPGYYSLVARATVWF